MHCLFCEIPTERVLISNEFAFAIRDAFPVTPHHTLVIPKTHKIDYFSLSNEELLACDQLLRYSIDEIQRLDSTVSGFNIGLNVGKSAGQTIFHCHFHLIPRRDGDVDEPRGGIRHVIPGKGFYDSKS